MFAGAGSHLIRSILPVWLTRPTPAPDGLSRFERILTRRRVTVCSLVYIPPWWVIVPEDVCLYNWRGSTARVMLFWPPGLLAPRCAWALPDLLITEVITWLPDSRPESISLAATMIYRIQSPGQPARRVYASHTHN